MGDRKPVKDWQIVVILMGAAIVAIPLMVLIGGSVIWWATEAANWVKGFPW